MAKTQSNYRDRVDTGLQEPRQYNVIFYNDDFTPMDFVVMVLKVVFRKSQDDAQALMMKVHKEGKAVAGTYSLDIAASKANKATRMAKQEDYPLKISVEHV